MTLRIVSVAASALSCVLLAACSDAADEAAPAADAPAESPSADEGRSVQAWTP